MPGPEDTPRGPVYHFIRILATGIGLLIFTLAVYERMGWTVTGDHYHVTVNQTAMGLPAWLVYNAAKIQGNPPPFDDRYMPEADRYVPGLHVVPQGLALAGLGLLIGTLLLYGAIHTAARSSPDRLTVVASYGSVIALASGIGVAVAADLPWWLLATAMLVLLPAAIVLWAMHTRRYVHTLGLIAIGVSVMWWSARMADHLCASHQFLEMEARDVIIPVLGVTVYAAFGCITVRLACTLAPRRSPVTPAA
jgi:hypothetical protein